MNLLELAITLLPKTKTEATTDAVAVAAITSSAWVNDLHGWLAIALQVFGILWLGVKIVTHLHTTYWKKK